MNADLALLAEPQRQSPLAVLFLALRTLRQIGIAQIVIAFVFLSRLPTLTLLLVVPAVGLVILGFGVVAWWRYTFLVADGEIRVTKGVLSEDKLTVPLDRVQSVSIEQRFLHRLVGLVHVSVDTAGTSEAEFAIDAVDRNVAEAVQRLAAEGRRTSTPSAEPTIDADGQIAPPAPVLPPEPERVVLTRDLPRLLLLGVARPAFAGLAVVFPLFAVLDDLGDVLPFDLPEIDGPEPAAWMLWLIPVALVIAFLGGLILNLIQVVITEWNLSLTVRDGGFRREAGLISRSSTATNIDRIQRVQVHQNPIERMVGIQRVNLPTIGEGDLHLPGTNDTELAELRDLVLDPDARIDTLDRTVSPLQVFLDTRNTSIIAVLLAVGLWFAIGPWSLLFLLLAPWEYLETRRSNRLYRWGLSAQGIAQHQEFVVAHDEELMLRKVNGAAIRQSFFERSRDLATVHLHTADGSFSVGMLPLDEAKAVRDRALMIAETNTKAWM